MTNLDYYLTYDHNARAKTTLLSVVVGIAASAVAAQLDLSPKTVGIVCIMAVGAVEVARAWRYVQPAAKKQIATADSTLRVRRSLLLAPLSILFFVAMSFLPVSRIEAAVIERKLKENAKDPFDEKNIQDTTRTLIHAQASNIKIETSLVSTTGEKFVDASVNTPEAWQAVLEFASYRSSQINPSLVPFLGPLRPGTTVVHGTIPYGDVWEAGDAPPETMARIQDLNEPYPWEHTPGPEFIVVEMHNEHGLGYAFSLDSKRFKKFIIKDAAIKYAGGRVWLEDVYFVNCSFLFEQTPAARDLSKQIITSVPVSFKSL